MSFQETNLRQCYDSGREDILNDFYIPILRESIEYKRLAGFFSSSALAVAARGIRGLLENDGKMKLIAGAILRKEDIEAIKNGLKKPSEVIEKFAIDDLEKIEDKFVKDHVSALGWLIAKGKLEIRVAIVKDQDGLPLDALSVLKRGIFHQKVGIFTDTDGQMISFSGSVNETARAWMENIEEFKVFRSWIEAEYQHFKSDYDKFDGYWNGETDRVEILEIPDAIKKRLIRMAPDDINSLDLSWKHKEIPISPIQPWEHQLNAVDAFKDNSYRGILKMATGTGKTYTGLLCLRQYFNDIKKHGNRILIIVPQDPLPKQWKEDLYEFVSKDDFVFTYHSKVKQKEKREACNVWIKDFSENIYLIITIDSIKNFSPYLKIRTPDFIIGDEVHSYGTENRMKTINNCLGNVKYRLGLSATPERYYDSDGTRRIKEYFGPNIFEYNMKDAQKDKILSEYFYNLYLTELTPAEEENVRDLTKKIGRKIAIDFTKEISEKEKPLPKHIIDLMIKRAKIIKKAENKLSVLREILKKEEDNLKQCIVYCEDTEQLNAVQKVFDN